MMRSRTLLLVVAIAAVATAAAAGNDGGMPPFFGGNHRDVEAFNLMSFIPAPVRSTLCDLLGCPNFAVMTSTDVKVNGTESEENLLVSITSTIKLPTTLLVYFKSKTDFKRLEWGVQIAEALLSGDFSGLLDMKDAAFAMGTVFDSIIEFLDVNGDGKYTPDVDTVRSTYSLMDAKWQAMSSSQQHVGDDELIVTLNVTTLDEVLSLQFTTASMPMAGQEAVLNPNSTKVDVQIDNFPYSAAGREDHKSKLALKTFVVSATASAKLSISFDDRIQVGLAGYYEWVEHALEGLNLTAVPVLPTFAATSASSAGDLDGTVLKMIMDVSTVVHSHDSIKTVYTAFDVEDSNHIYWDPSLGYNFAAAPGNGPPSHNPSPSGMPTWLVSFLIVGGVIAVVSVGLIARRMRAGRERGAYPPLVPKTSSG